MEKRQHRLERDTLGEIAVPANALYGAQTQRAVGNFPISGLRLPGAFLHALALIKRECAAVNREIGRLDPETAAAIEDAAASVQRGEHDDQFPVDVFQTGSGTSTNMNANEVIATLATRKLGRQVHPNDHVNCCQSSNDVIPTAIHVSACFELGGRLEPALEELRATIDHKAIEVGDVVKTGRTHLMDALPILMRHELSAWSDQVAIGLEGVHSSYARLHCLPLGATAIGTGINAPPEFGPRVIVRLKERTGVPFTVSGNRFAAISSQGPAAQLSGSLRTAAIALMKVANDLRWMNSGPNAGLGEISLPALQPGSSIMPGKVNPVIPEAILMACAQVIGHDAAIALAAQSGSFQLNTMLPLVAYDLLESIQLLANSANALARKAISGFEVHHNRLAAILGRNPVFVTALAPRIGYDRAAEIAEKARAERKTIQQAAAELTDLPREEIEHLLDPARLASGENRS